MSGVAERKPQEIVVIRDQLESRKDEFKAALPAHIPAERFIRVVLTAVQANPELMRLNRRSLFTSALKCATDGLLPDGREAALVPYKDEVQYLPMIAGIRKKVRNSGDIATWDVHAVYEGDDFDYALGDDPFVRHKPTLGERGKLLAVYSIATLKTGEKSRDVMSRSDVEKIRALSRGKNTPWSNPTFYPEMAKKTVAKRHAKVLPMSTDLDDLLRRDDALYDLDGASDKVSEKKRDRTLTGKLDALAHDDREAGPLIEAKPEPDRVGSVEQERASEDVNRDAGDDFPGDERPREQSPEDVAFDSGWKAFRDGMARRAVPGEYRNDNRLVGAWQRGFDEAAADDRGA